MLVVCLLFCFAVVAKSGPGLVAVDPRSLGSSNRCDPSTQSGTKRPHPNQNTAYFYCNIDGTLARRDCPSGKYFSRSLLDCEPVSVVLGPNELPGPILIQHAPPKKASAEESEASNNASETIDPLKLPQFQAPDDLCSGVSGGNPLTRLGSPVVCNPNFSSCPDGYQCTVHQRTGIWYCCQQAAAPEPPVPDGNSLCQGNQVTYIEPQAGIPKACAIASSYSGCPTGFGCNLVNGGLPRCCGKDFGCPANSAGFVNPTTGTHVQCNLADPLSCPNGFICIRSSMFNIGICCSDTSTSSADTCGGEAPLGRPNPCSATNQCPFGFGCRNGRCCPTSGQCPAGQPLGGQTSCSSTSNPCPNNYQCITSNGQQHCCPSPEHVCGQPLDSGVRCQGSDGTSPSVTHFYFDSATGTCRSFHFSQCGGNANNFDTLDQCEGFCLDSQCPKGTGLRAGPALSTCSSAALLGGDNLPPMFTAAPPITDQCPSHYQCVQPRYGVSPICCTAPENVCREPVQAGSPCFGPFRTFTRYYYNIEKEQCEPFQYYGCSGSGNNFITKRECEESCQKSLKTACNGVAPLNDEGDYVRRCSENTGCPNGAWCNQRGYCCPHQETACTSMRSIGHTCLSQRPGTYWYFEDESDSCLPFTYSGCGGTPNRFVNRESCEQMCGVAGKGVGKCPRGMTPFLTTMGAKKCGTGLIKSGVCPDGSSCVQSSLGEWICCTSTAQCPIGRSAYIIPGSDSNVACLPDDEANNCPQGFQCVQSGNVQGFFMCCSSVVSKRLMLAGNNLPSAIAALAAAAAASVVGKARVVSATVMSKGSAPPTLQYSAPKCPGGLPSNGERCNINEIEACPTAYLCVGTGDGRFSDDESVRGICCKVQPKCTRRNRKPYYIAKKQVLTCTDDEKNCPIGTQCQRSSVPGIEICCMDPGSSGTITDFISATTPHSGLPMRHRPRSRPMANIIDFSSPDNQNQLSGGVSNMPRRTSAVPKVVPKCIKDGSLPYFALGSRIPQHCTTERDDECPEEYECEQGSDDQFYCCPAWDRCPAGSSPFLVEGSRKPLGCNWQVNNCPEGYSCEGSKDRAICCRTRPSAAQCPIGRTPYLMAKRPLVCPLDAKKNTCPVGYECIPSRKGGINVCCSKLEHQTPECVHGYAYYDSTIAKNQVCDPALDTCPIGYRCKRSTMANAHVCCTIQLDNRIEGYCPLGQIPYMGPSSTVAENYVQTPPTCHMVHSPCPTSGPYQCIYSVEKQNSYCCAPVDTSTRFSGVGTPFRQWPKQPAPYQLSLQFQQQRGAEGEYAQPIANGCRPMDPQQALSVNPAGSIPMGAYLRAIASPPGASENVNPSEIPPQLYSTGQEQQIAGGCSQTTVQQQQQPYFQSQQQQSATTNVDALLPQQPSPSSSQQGNAFFVASCPPYSKPLLDANTGLGQPCSVWDRCPPGFTCYSNFPDGRNAHCCTTVPLDNQVVFRANTAALFADGPPATAQRNNLTQSSSFVASNPSTGPAFDESSMQQQPYTATSSVQYAPMKMDPSAVPNGPNATMITTVPLPTPIPRCPPNMINIYGMCKRIYFVGQPGCEVDSQCNARTNGTRCNQGHCVCPEGQLIHESKCVTQCPNGFLIATGRCHDLSTIVFMDSVDQRDNGSIGGFCMDTIIADKQCQVVNAYCSERSLTCQCRPGFELQMDFSNRTDMGQCVEVVDSRFNKVLKDSAMSQNQVDADENDSIEKEDLVIDELEDSLSRSDSSESGQQPVLNRAFYAIDATAPEGTKSMSAKSNSTTTNVDEQKPTLEAAISSTASSQINASSTRNYNATKGVTDASKTDKKDENLTNVFFQSDE